MSKQKPKYFHKKPSVSQIDAVSKYEVTPVHGYFAFNLYFNEDCDDKMRDIIKKTQTFESYLLKNLIDFDLKKTVSDKSFTISLPKLYKDEVLISEWPSFKDDINNNFYDTNNTLSMAMHHLLELKMENFNKYETIACHVKDHLPLWNIKNLRVNAFGKLVTVKGTVIKAKSVQMQIVQLEFLCHMCQQSQIIKQIDGVYTVPKKCSTRGCRTTTNFVPVKKSQFSKSISTQIVIIQEMTNFENFEDNGRIPRTVHCELGQDLVGLCIPGDELTVTGVLKARNTNEGNNKFKTESIFQTYLDVNYIEHDRNKTNSVVSFSTQDYYAIQKIHSEPNLLRFLVHSLCPKIYGHEIVKAGILLSLFGGTKDTNFRRSESHILIIGEPGLGKSQMLQACANVAPRGVYVCGNTSTTSGLTVTMSRENKGQHALEAGALVLADQGCCCIDEFDKMTQQHAGLLEVMEQQSISIAKAGVSCTVPTCASVVAAANPVRGHYDKSKTVSENLKMSAPLLSRFDLIFILFDKSNEQLDLLLVEHVLALRTGEKSTLEQFATLTGNVETLKNRLALKNNEHIDVLPHALFRKYIAYAKKYVHPQLNSEAKSILKQFYLDLRKQYHKGDSTPLTTRQLESLARLTQARAKLELREEATAQDALDVVEIMRNSLIDVFSNNAGTLDFSRAQNGTGISNKSMVVKFVKSLHVKSDTLQRNTFHVKELKTFAVNLGIPLSNFQSLLDSANLQGFLLNKGGGNYQFTLCD